MQTVQDPKREAQRKLRDFTMALLDHVRGNGRTSSEEVGAPFEQWRAHCEELRMQDAALADHYARVHQLPREEAVQQYETYMEEKKEHWSAYRKTRKMAELRRAVDFKGREAISSLALTDRIYTKYVVGL